MLLAEESKKCTRCGEQKSLGDFYHSPTIHTSDKLHCWCKECFLDHRRRKWANDPEMRARAAILNKRRCESSPRSRLSQARHAGLKRRPSDNPITIDELIGLWESQRGMCALSGIKMTWSAGNQGGKKLPTSVSLDRIDNLGGYEFGNIRLICDVFNAFRGEMSNA